MNNRSLLIASYFLILASFGFVAWQQQRTICHQDKLIDLKQQSIELLSTTADVKNKEVEILQGMNADCRKIAEKNWMLYLKYRSELQPMDEWETIE